MRLSDCTVSRPIEVETCPVGVTIISVADAARSIPGAGALFFWDSVNWGEWALVYGKLAAVKQGAADRIKREATIAYLSASVLQGTRPFEEIHES